MQNKNNMNNSICGKSSVVLNNTNNDNNINDNKEGNNTEINEKNKYDNENVKEIKEEIYIEEKNNIEEEKKKNDDNNNVTGVEIIRKTDNPYEIPEDF